MSRSIREHADAARQKLRQLQHKVEEKALLQTPAVGESSDSDTSQLVREIKKQLVHMSSCISLLDSFPLSLDHSPPLPLFVLLLFLNSPMLVNLFHTSYM